VVEGDEYDSAFFEKVPKFWSYRPWGAVITSIEHDHVDIYPTLDAYRDAFRGFVARMPPDGVLVANANDREVVSVCDRAPCRVAYYALSSDHDAFVDATWTAARLKPEGGTQPFDVFVGGARAGIVLSPLAGEHNVRNALASIALLSETLSVPLTTLARGVQSFAGVRRRQELVGIAGGVRVYDDFAHHPTAVAETLRALRSQQTGGRLIAVFEPRSATASRNTHQWDYPAAFDVADLALIAPVGRSEISAADRLDVHAIVAAIRSRGRAKADTVDPGPGGVDAIVAKVVEFARAGDTVAVLSNGAFGGIHGKLVAALGA
jgi:UDP-N-acetylmuramate: L-alanyl-gamma-D-glutamyl-meso-diaminopimelate ligase